MRSFSVLLALILLATPASAQTSHPEVVDAVIEVADLETVLRDMMGPMLQSLPGSPADLFSVEVLEDSLRARLRADGRTDALREVLAYLQSPANATLLVHGRELVDEISDPAGAAAFQRRVDEQKKGALADEALVRRYQRAQGTTEMMSEMMPRMFEAFAQASPEFAAVMEAQGGVDALGDMFGEEEMAEFTESQVAAMRVAHFGVPRDVLEQAVAFAESEAGRYYTTASAEVTMDVMIPAMADYFAQMMSGMAALADGPPPPPPPGRPGTEIYDVAEVQPELIGGMASIAPEYPEEARRAGIEGRVIVQFVVDERGAVTQAQVVRSPHNLLSQAALAAVRTLRFTPGMTRGRPVKVRFSLPVTFRLRDATDDRQ